MLHREENYRGLRVFLFFVSFYECQGFRMLVLVGFWSYLKENRVFAIIILYSFLEIQAEKTANIDIRTFKIPPTFARTSAIDMQVLWMTVFLIFSCLICILRNRPSLFFFNFMFSFSVVNYIPFFWEILSNIKPELSFISTILYK